MPHLEAITIHARQPAELAPFWSAALGLPIDPADVAAIADGTLGDRESVLLGQRDGLHVWVSPADELPELGGRVHLDVRLDDDFGPQDLLDAGATLVWDEPQGRWSVYTDPEDNRFCAVPATGKP
ncbi:VOC family protein [Nocardioides sp. URHA0032]|uniref:VOC family protein n=1 Tax=Nocardioides sp. URHA0032 TaxID=1380388 RepID=UPI00048DCB52|nr:VOC family protein [Nocardioides sp. URHA0032]